MTGIGQVIGRVAGSLDGADWARNRGAAAAGAAAERLTAGTLVAAVELGATVLHDLDLPKSRAAGNIDHAIVSGSTVTLIDSKWWKGGRYWTLRGTTRRGLDRFAPADSRALADARSSIERLLVGAGADVATPLVAVWGNEPHRLGLYRPHGAIAMRGAELADWLAGQQWQTADPRIVRQLARLVRA